MSLQHQALKSITPDWPAPHYVKAYSSTRAGGYSKGSYQGFNLSLRSGDDPATVALNRQLLCESLKLPAEPYWIDQVHGIDVIACVKNQTVQPKADGSYTDQSNIVCEVLTADC